MEIINCPKCGKLFSKLSSPICEQCQKDEEDLFQVVRKYVDEHPNCLLKEVTNETGVSVKKIMKYLRDGRLEVSTGMRGILKCEKCGKPISRGHYCDSCVIELNQIVVDIFEDSKKVKMHTRN